MVALPRRLLTAQTILTGRTDQIGCRAFIQALRHDRSSASVTNARATDLQITIVPTTRRSREPTTPPRTRPKDLGEEAACQHPERDRSAAVDPTTGSTAWAETTKIAIATGTAGAADSTILAAGRKNLIARVDVARAAVDPRRRSSLFPRGVANVPAAFRYLSDRPEFRSRA